MKEARQIKFRVKTPKNKYESWCGNRVLQRILESRLTEKQARTLYGDPWSLIQNKEIYGMTSVAEEIIFQKDKNIYIFADYDVDGLTSGFILSSFLKDILGYKVETYYPERSEGYGLSPEFANNLNDKDAVVITVDNGITANEAVNILANKCIPTIIIDHHEPAGELPEAVELCDAHIDKNYGTHLCCAAVTWKVVHKIAELLNWPEDKIRLLDRSYLPYVALGTISDVMPPVLENYAIIALGLEEINEGQSNTLSSLMEQEGIKKMTSKDLAWTIAPELNACSRMGNVKLGKDFFSQEMLNKKTALQKLTKEIIKLNKTRKDITEKAYQEIVSNNDFSATPICFVNVEKYPQGIHGIIAGKVSEAFNKPTVTYSSNGHASCRGEGVKDILNAYAPTYVEGAFGHSDACGARIIVKKIPQFIKRLNSDIEKKRLKLKHTEPTITLDAELTLQDFNKKTREDILDFGFTGQDMPTVGLLNVNVEPIVWATKGGKKHIFLRLGGKNIYAIGWNLWDEYERLGAPTTMNLSGSLDSGEYAKYCKDVLLTGQNTILTISNWSAA